MTRKLIQIAAWLSLLAIIIATLGPIDLRPHSSMGVDNERALAFVGLGFLFAIAYPRHVWWTALLVIICTCGLEMLQNLRPDRHGREFDAMVKVMGGLGGMAIGWAIWRVSMLLTAGNKVDANGQNSA